MSNRSIFIFAFQISLTPMFSVACHHCDWQTPLVFLLPSIQFTAENHCFSWKSMILHFYIVSLFCCQWSLFPSSIKTWFFWIDNASQCCQQKISLEFFTFCVVNTILVQEWFVFAVFGQDWRSAFSWNSDFTRFRVQINLLDSLLLFSCWNTHGSLRNKFQNRHRTCNLLYILVLPSFCHLGSKEVKTPVVFFTLQTL